MLRGWLHAALAALVCLLVACEPRPASTQTYGALGRTSTSPASWAVANWYIDPVSGSDNNTCTTSGAPCQHYYEIVARWGTQSPILKQATTINFLTDASTDGDPVILTPLIAKTGSISLIGTLQSVSWGSSTLGTVTAKSRSAGTQLQANLGQAASGAVGLLLQNSTHASISWVDAAASNVGTLTQPLVAAASPAPGMTLTPAEVDTTATSDTFAIKQPTKAHVVVFEPTAYGGDGSFDGVFGFMQHIWVPDSQAVGASQAHFNHAVVVTESRIDRVTVTHDIDLNNGALAGFSNCYLNGSGFFAGVLVNAGAVNTGAAFLSFFSSSIIDGDAYLHSQTLIEGPTNISNGAATGLHLAWATGTVRVDVGAIALINNGSYSTRGLWGTYTVNVKPNAFLGYQTSAATSFLATPTLQLNGGTTGWSVTSAQPSVWNGGITVNVTNLDAAAGASGFGGSAVEFLSNARIGKVQ